MPLNKFPVKVYPSLLAADILCLEQSLMSIASADGLHIDIMDGHFVPNINFGVDWVKAVKKRFSFFLDCHLMVQSPQDWISRFVDAGADQIGVHANIQNFESILTTIQAAGVKASVVLSPDVPVSSIESVLSFVDTVLVMTVKPGWGGQKFMPEMVQKIQMLAQKNAFSFEIAVDGGICLEHIAPLVDLGVSQFVVGSALFQEKDRSLALEKFRSAAKRLF